MQSVSESAILFCLMYVLDLLHIFHNKQILVSRIAFQARNVFGAFEKQAPGVCFSKVPITFRARKAICKPACQPLVQESRFF